MTSLASALGTASEEDPMELSMDFERRFLGEEDIDIDLGLGGKSPYNQEDDYMLEDNSSMENHATYNSRQDNNDDEMVDELGTPQPLADAPDVYAESGVDDATGFDILVDDEDLADADDSMSQSDSVGSHTEQVLESHTVSSSQLPQDSDHYLESNDFSILQPLGNRPDVTQSVHETILITNNSDTAEEKSLYSTQGTKPSIDLYSSLGPSVDANKYSTISKSDDFANLPQESHPELLLGLDQSDRKPSAEEAIEEDFGSKREDDERDSYTMSGHESATSGPDRTPTTEDPSTETPEKQELHDSDNLENMSHDTLEDRNAVRHSTDTELATDLSGVTTGDLGGQEQHDDLTHDTADREPNNLHPVIVVYQDNEISLFPPHEQTEKQSATYFLQDESIANESIRALLGACRVILADSIGEQDELEIKIVHLGVDICETCSEASTVSLQQIMNLYLQLQLNDGVHYPDPLHMILTTKFSLPYRLQYLHNAVEEGLGFLDIAIPGSVEVVEARAEKDDEQSQETLEMTNEELEKLVGQGSTVTDLHDEGDEKASKLQRLLDNQETVQRIEIKPRDSNPTITQGISDSHENDQQLNAGNHDSEEELTSFSITSQSVKQVEPRSDDVSATATTNTSLSGHAVEAEIPDIMSRETLYSGDIDYDGEDQEAQISSAASSTLRGDTSDIVAGEIQVDSLAIISQDERQSREASYGEDDLEDLDTIVTNSTTETSHLNSGSMDHTAALDRPSNPSSILLHQRHSSTSISEIDNNEISYENEDGDEDKNQDEDTNDNNVYDEADDNGNTLTTGSHSIRDHRSRSATPLSQHDSLKRARGVEDDDGSSLEVDQQADMKRVRST